MSDPLPPLDILIVDDAPEFRLLLERRLRAQRTPTAVRSAENVKEAEAALAGSPADVILVDHELPDGTGVDFIARLCQSGSPAVKVLLSGNLRPETISDAFAAGADDVFVKEDAVSRMSAFVERLLALHSRRISQAASPELSRRAARAIAESEGRLWEFALAAPDVLYRLDLRRGRYEFISPTIETLLGYPVRDALDDPAGFTRRAIHPEDLAEAERAVRTHVASGPTDKPLVLETRLVRKDGRVVWVRDHMRFAWEGTTPILATGVLSDVTETKAAQTMLERERRAFAIIVEAAVNGVSVEDVCRRVLVGLVESLGFSSGTMRLHVPVKRALELVASHGLDEALVQQTCPSLDDPDCVASYVGRTRAAVFAPDVSVHPIWTTHRARLEKIGIRAMISWPLLGSGGALIGVLQLMNREPTAFDEGDRVFFEAVAGMFAAVLERKRAEAQLARLAAAIDQAREAIVITDDQGNIEYVNPAFERVSGYKRADAIGRTPRIMKSGAHPSEYYERLWERLSAGEDWVGEFVNRRKDGTLYNEEASISPIRDSVGRVTGFVAVKLDVTARKQAEAALARANADLEGFVHTVSHDLRAPLGVVASLADLLCEDLTSAGEVEAIRTAEEIRDSVRRLHASIERLLVFARLGNRPIETRPTDVREPIREAVSRLKNEVKKYRATIALPEDELVVMADYDLLVHVFQNLVGNSLRYAADGRRSEIAITCRKRDDATAEVRVSDNGRGMPTADIPTLFEPFKTGSLGGGTGLGLAIVRRIVEAHAGTIEVQSECGVGTTFTMTFPVR